MLTREQNDAIFGPSIRVFRFIPAVEKLDFCIAHWRLSFVCFNDL